MELSTTEPLFIQSGDTVSWSKLLASSYPASGGWSLVYTLTLQSDASKRLQVTATDSNDVYTVTITAAQSAALTAGTYFIFGHVVKASERYQVFSGTIEVRPNLAALTTGDIRSTVKRTLDAIEATIQNRATSDQQQMTIDGRTLVRIPMAELLVLHDKYKTYYSNELLKGQIARTGVNPRYIGVRFVRL